MQRHMRLAAVLLVLPLFLIEACGDDDDDDTTTPPATDEFSLVAQVGEAYFAAGTTPAGDPVEIDAAAVWALLSDRTHENDPYILDWRSWGAFEVAHLEGAHRVSLADFDRVLSSIPDDRTVLNVCRTGHEASQVTAFMNMLGIPAQTLRFGMCGWTAERRATQGLWDDAISDAYDGWLVTAPTTPAMKHSFPTLDTGKSTGREILRERAIDYLANGSKRITIEEFAHDLATDPQGDSYFLVQCSSEDAYAAGHLPNAVYFDMQQDLRVDRLLQYLPTDRKIVVICSTGFKAAQVAAYLNALGYEAYTLLYGANGLCYSNEAACPTRYETPATNYPVAWGHEPEDRFPGPQGQDGTE